MSNDTVNEHVYIVNKRVSISEKTGDLNSRPKQLHSEIMNYTLPRHRRKNNRRKVNRMGTLSQDVVLEGQCACHRSQKGGKYERRHTSHSKTTISFWETGLNPLKVGEDRVGDALDCLFEQSVEPLERWMRH